MYRSGRRWLLPDVLRTGVVLVDVALAGAALLAWVGGYATTELLAGLGGAFLLLSVLALIPRRVPPAARTLAAVLSVNLPPADRILGRCVMTLRLNDLKGVPRQFTHVDPHTPTAMWPTEGSRVIVEVTKADTPKARVLWHLGVVHPEPAPESGEEPLDERGIPVRLGLSDADLRALPNLELVETVLMSEPSHVARRYLYPTERFRGEWRRHWIRWVKELSVALALALLIVLEYRARVGELDIDFADIPYPEAVSQAVWFILVGWRGLTWLNNRLILTNRRIMLIKGIFWRRVASLPLAKAADIFHTKSPLGAVLGYGAFRFTNVPPLRPLWRVGDLPVPRDLYLQIVGETFEPGAELRRAAALAEEDDSLDDVVAAQFIG